MFLLKQWPPFNMRHLLFIKVCCFQLAEPSRPCSSRFCLCFHPHIGLLKVLRPRRQTGFVHFFFFFNAPSPSLFLWMGRCEAHGPSRGREGKQNLFTRNAKRKESWREGWLDEGRGAGLHLMWGPSKACRGESKPTTADLMLRPLVNLKASIRQPVFGRLLHPLVFFLPTFAFSHRFFFFFFGALLRAQPQKLETWIVKKTHCKNF